MIFDFARTARLTSIRPGRLYGTAAIAGDPDTPVRRRVQLFTSANAHGQVFPATQYVDWQWSAADGSWSFSDLDPSRRYHAIAYDHTGVHDPVLKLNLVPTVD